MKARNLGHVRHRQKTWLKKFNATPWPCRCCDSSASHDTAAEASQGAEHEHVCPNCGTPIGFVTTWVADFSHWERRRSDA